MNVVVTPNQSSEIICPTHAPPRVTIRYGTIIVISHKTTVIFTARNTACSVAIGNIAAVAPHQTAFIFTTRNTARSVASGDGAGVVIEPHQTTSIISGITLHSTHRVAIGNASETFTNQTAFIATPCNVARYVAVCDCTIVASHQTARIGSPCHRDSNKTNIANNSRRITEQSCIIFGRTVDRQVADGVSKAVESNT